MKTQKNCSCMNPAATDFKGIQTIRENGKVYFCGKDIARILGYKKARNAILRHCLHSIKRRVVRQSHNSFAFFTRPVDEVAFITADDALALIMKSAFSFVKKIQLWLLFLGVTYRKKEGVRFNALRCRRALPSPAPIHAGFAVFKNPRLAASASKRSIHPVLEHGLHDAVARSRRHRGGEHG